ncbi:hypothetical protein ACIU1J_30100 [Azospirillum doebereinerae]|uniref:hypothetical protein n=1 Tax=Azospirillum doebereinerae TaxID=92933 RepID=UPI001EE57C2E|nr:hypothetical protein [Azospirillum doebereinerae]MCG5240943.1 hypothetical protein [Azospirillum doebereinerae]
MANMIGRSTNIRYPMCMDNSHLTAARLILNVAEGERKPDETGEDRCDRARRVLRAIWGKVFKTCLH